MSAESLIKGRIQATLNRIAAAGLTAPDYSHLTEPSEQEAFLKSFWNENKPDPEQTKEEAKSIVKAIADDRVAALEARLAQFESLLRSTGTNTAGLTGEDLIKAITAGVEKAQAGKQTDMGIMREEYIPPDDLLEKAEIFFVPNNGHNIWGKRIGNHWTVPPMGKECIKFRRAWGWVSREGPHLRQKRIATYECMSKTISEWLKSLPEFGKLFYLDLNEAMEASGNLTIFQIHAKHYGALMGKSYKEITAIAGSEGIPITITGTHETYAQAIAEKRATREVEANRSNFERAMRAKGITDMVSQPAAQKV